MRDPKKIALTWVLKSKSTGDSYDRFVFLWFALNALYNGYLQNSERGAIGDLVYSERHRINNAKIEELLGSASVEFFKSRIIRDCRGTGMDTTEQAARLKSNSFSKKVKLKNLLFILYQVRCNLFHGNKMFGRDSDDKVVAHAANVLEKIMDVLLA